MLALTLQRGSHARRRDTGQRHCLHFPILEDKFFKHRWLAGVGCVCIAVAVPPMLGVFILLLPSGTYALILCYYF